MAAAYLTHSMADHTDFSSSFWGSIWLSKDIGSEQIPKSTITLGKMPSFWLCTIYYSTLMYRPYQAFCFYMLSTSCKAACFARSDQLCWMQNHSYPVLKVCLCFETKLVDLLYQTWHTVERFYWIIGMNFNSSNASCQVDIHIVNPIHSLQTSKPYADCTTHLFAQCQCTACTNNYASLCATP